MKDSEKYFLIVVLLSLCGPILTVSAVQPRIRTFNSFDDFIPGKPQQVTLSHDGRLRLSPTIKMLCDTGEPYIWALVSDRHGDIFLATGNEGRIYKVTANGDTSLFFDAPEPEIYALTIDAQDQLYAAASPNGKVYRIKTDGSSELFFQTDDTYIWDIKLDASGHLLVATGNKAKLYRVKPDGSSQLIYQSEAEHIRCLSLAADHTLYWGTSHPGLIYRLDEGGLPYVVYDPSAEEVHDLAMAEDGSIFAAIFSEPTKAGMPMPQEEKATESESSAGETVLSSLSMLVEETASAKARTKLLMITPDYYATNIWNQSEDIQSVQVFQDEVVVGTNKRGRIFRVNRSGEASLIGQLDPTHISAIYKTNDNSLYLACANMGRCYLLANKMSERGLYESPVIDAGNFSSWGVLQWQGMGTIHFATRSGNSKNPEGSWSAWEKVANDDGVLRIKSPAARFLQWRSELLYNHIVAPEIRQVSISYLQKNVPPAISKITIQPHGIYLGNAQPPEEEKGIIEPQQPPKGEKKKGYRSVEWQFSDPNGDAVWFDLYYRRVTEKHWRLLIKEYAGNYYSFDSFQWQDGIYQIKIVASDGCNQPPGEGLTSEKISQEFIIDNTGPVIQDIKQEKLKSEITITFCVCDALHPLQQVVYSINGQEWQKIHPIDGMCDSLCEYFSLKQPLATAIGEISIKATDIFDNTSVAHRMLTDSK